LEEVMRIVSKMGYEEIKTLHDAIVKMIATPLQNPHDYYDDWDDAEVDRAYAETWSEAR